MPILITGLILRPHSLLALTYSTVRPNMAFPQSSSPAHPLCAPNRLPGSLLALALALMIASTSYSQQAGLSEPPSSPVPWLAQSSPVAQLAQRPEATSYQYDLNPVSQEPTPSDHYDTQIDGCDDDCYTFQLMPKGLIYRGYMAGQKESQFRSVWNHEKDNGWIWDITLGGRAGIMRYGTSGNVRPEGWQLDIEGAGQVRLDMEEERDVDAADFRFGTPITYGTEWHQFKVAFYHLSSHVGDEYMLKHPTFQRYNYSRDVLLFGYSIYPIPEVRFYAEAGWAFFHDVGEPWEFQFGFEYSPAGDTGLRGVPFFALNAHLREEVDFGGGFAAQAGWAWRGSPSSGTFRAGVQYYTGNDEQFSFYNESVSKVGLALWYDY